MRRKDAPLTQAETSPVRQMRRALRRWRSLRRLYYWVWGTVTGPADPMALRLVPEEAFRGKVRELVAQMIQRQGKEDIGDYLEFGVFNGATLSSVYQVFQEFGLDGVRFFGFDSFEGLPPEADHEDEGLWFPGQCSCSVEVTMRFLTAHQVDWTRVFLIKGWFRDTLTPALTERYRMRKASLVMVDCDLYSSTVDCLRFVEPLIRDEAILIFDDWFAFQAAERNLGEKRAFEEFLGRHPELEPTELGGYYGHSLIFRVARRR